MECTKAKITRDSRKKWDLDGRLLKVYGNGVKKGSVKSRREEVVAAQLRAGHVTRSAYYKKRFKIDEDGRCPKCREEEDKDHVWNCPAEIINKRDMGLPMIAEPELASKVVVVVHGRIGGVSEP